MKASGSHLLSSGGSTPPVALISAAMLEPFTKAFVARGGDKKALMSRVGLRESDFEAEFLPAKRLWEYIECASEALGDRHFGYVIGSNTPAPSLPNLSVLEPTEITLGERLSKLVIDARRLTNQAVYSLSHDAVSATLKQRRRFRPYRAPTQSDGFFAGFILRLMRDCVGPRFDGSQILIRLSDLKAIPNSALPRSSLITSGSHGVTFRFPSEWLLLGDEGRHNQNHPVASVNEFDFLPVLRREIKARVSSPHLKLADLSNIFSFSDRSLQKALAARGTSFRRELDLVREERAKDMLSSSDLPISKIARAVGFTAATSFTRSFQKWTGLTPTEYRLPTE